MAIQAGHDMLLKPANAIAAIEALVQAVEKGEIAFSRIDASVEKILYWKARLGLQKERFVDLERIASVVGAKAHRDLVREVAERSLTILTNRGVFPTSLKALGRIVYVSIQKTEGDPAPVAAAQKMREGLALADAFLLGPGVDPARYDAVRERGRSADTVVVGLFHQRNVYRDGGVLPARDLELLREFEARGVRTIVLSFGNPYLARDLRFASAFVVGYGEGGFYGNQLVYADASFGRAATTWSQKRDRFSETAFHSFYFGGALRPLKQAAVGRDHVEAAAIGEGDPEDARVRAVQEAQPVEARGHRQPCLGRPVRQGHVPEVAVHQVHRRRRVPERAVSEEPPVLEQDRHVELVRGQPECPLLVVLHDQEAGHA